VLAKGDQDTARMSRLLTFLRGKLAAHPNLANCGYYGTLFCAAEVSQQVYLRKIQPWRQVIIIHYKGGKSDVYQVISCHI